VRRSTTSGAMTNRYLGCWDGNRPPEKRSQRESHWDAAEPQALWSANVAARGGSPS